MLFLVLVVVLAGVIYFFAASIYCSLFSSVAGRSAMNPLWLCAV
jgi:hypothetical protein